MVKKLSFTRNNKKCWKLFVEKYGEKEKNIVTEKTK